jgi:DNA-directed RNA polymerase subunit H
MASLSQLLPIEVSYEKQKEMIITNIVKMLMERNVLNKRTDFNKYIENVIFSLKDNDTFDIKVDNPEEAGNNIYHIILLMDQKITTVTKTSIIGEHLYDKGERKTKDHKIIIVEDISPRARQAIQLNFPTIEVFLRKEQMFNIVDSIYVPKHSLLSQEESDQVLKEFGLQKKDMPKILTTDPIVLYFHAKIGQIFRIIRPSETAGYATYYRLVVKSTVAEKSK